MRLKKETLIIIFYVLYFSWLFAITFLSLSTRTLNIFTATVAFFYILFLREKGDLIWFWVAGLVPVFFTVFSLSNWQPKLDLRLLIYLPPWIPMAWGSTVVALRKFFNLVSR